MNVRIRPLRRRTPLERAVKAAQDVDIKQPPKAVTSAAAAGAAAVAASAAVSALRRRAEGR
jgi:hypothetical protein